MIATDQAAMLMDQGEVVGSDGDSIGKVGQLYVDNENGQLTWVTVKTGWFGMNESFVPLDHATLNGSTITVPYDKAMVKDAPNFDAGAELSVDDENELYSYYGVNHGTTSAPSATDTAGYGDTTRAPEASASASHDDGYLTRSEEQLRVGTTRVEAGRARLRKFVVTEQQSVTVPVSHEEVQIVREPLRPGDSLDGATIGEDSVEVTLMADKVVVDKDVVGIEKVKLGTETVTEQQAVTESVRKEQIEMSTDGDQIIPGQQDSTVESVGDRDESLLDRSENAVR